MEAVRRRIEEAPQRLVISIDGIRVQLVDELGRTTNLVADGKKQDRLTGDGEFKSITRLEGGRLVVEEDFDGPKVTTTYERLTSDGESRLQVTLQIDGMPEGPRWSRRPERKGADHAHLRFEKVMIRDDAKWLDAVRRRLCAESLAVAPAFLYRREPRGGIVRNSSLWTAGNPAAAQPESEQRTGFLKDS